jgi:hypothetical protein
LVIGSAGVSGSSKQRRNAVGLVTSLVLHLFILGLIINQQPPDYDLLPSPAVPQPVTPAPEPAMDVRIIKLTVPPRIEPAPVTHPPPAPTPRPPTPSPPAPPQPEAPPTPQAQPVVPPHPTVLPPTPAPTPVQQAPSPPKPAPTPAATPTPTRAPPKPAPTPRPAPAPTVSEAKAPPAPSPTPATPAAAKPAAATPLNIHKAAQPTPAGVPTLPMAPAAGAGGRPAAPTSAAQSGAPAGSRLNGLNPYPYGFMPSGGGGLRGTLVGCANAEAVRLSGAERDKCNERFGVDISGAPKIDGIPAAKRAAFDKAAATDAAWAKYRASGQAPVGPSEPGGIDHGPASSEVLDHPASDYPPK